MTHSLWLVNLTCIFVIIQQNPAVKTEVWSYGRVACKVFLSLKTMISGVCINITAAVIGEKVFGVMMPFRRFQCTMQRFYKEINNLFFQQFFSKKYFNEKVLIFEKKTWVVWPGLHHCSSSCSFIPEWLAEILCKIRIFWNNFKFQSSCLAQFDTLQQTAHSV